MHTIANQPDSGKSDTCQAPNHLCVIVGWRRIKGAWADIHSVVDNGTFLVREPTGFRVMFSEGVMQGLRS